MLDGKKPACEEPDWGKLVREHMGPLDLPCDIQENVVNELAAHLQETYEAARSQRIREEEALELALQEVEDWNVLATNIQCAKEERIMNHRTKSLWMPVLANLIAAPGLLMVLQKLGVHPRVLWTGNMAMVLYLPWLATLPAFGAFGAFLAKRAQASPLYRIVSGTAPALAMLGSYVIILPVSLVFETGFSWVYFALSTLNWILLPAFALLLGAAPFLRDRRTLAPVEA